MATKRTKTLEPHPLSSLMPMMSETELKKLRADILEVGLKEPITLFEGKILDGRNRYQACQDLGVDPAFEEFTGTEDEALDYVLAKNVHRRQLTSSQKAVIALRCLDQIKEEVQQRRIERIKETVAAKKEMGELLPSSPKKAPKATDIAGMIVGVSGRYVADAQLLQEKAPEMVDKVLAGEVPLSRAVKQFKSRAKNSRGTAKAKARRSALRRLIRQVSDEPSVADLLRQALAELERVEAEAVTRT
jgi:ParB-like chromosome segregation protein Spo0J